LAVGSQSCCRAGARCPRDSRRDAGATYSRYEAFATICFVRTLYLQARRQELILYASRAAISLTDMENA